MQDQKEYEKLEKREQQNRIWEEKRLRAKQKKVQEERSRKRIQQSKGDHIQHYLDQLENYKMEHFEAKKSEKQLRAEIVKGNADSLQKQKYLDYK